MLRPFQPIFDPQKKRGALLPGNTPRFPWIQGFYVALRVQGNGCSVDSFSAGLLGSAASFSDDFNRPDSVNLGGNWVEGEQYGDVLDIFSNTLRSASTDPLGGGMARYATPLAGIDQWSEFTITSTGTVPTKGFAVRLRNVAPLSLSNAVEFGYPNGLGGYRLISTGNAVAFVAAALPSVGTVIRGEAEGNDYRLYVDGVLTLSASDP